MLPFGLCVLQEDFCNLLMSNGSNVWKRHLSCKQACNYENCLLLHWCFVNQWILEAYGRDFANIFLEIFCMFYKGNMEIFVVVKTWQKTRHWLT